MSKWNETVEIITIIEIITNTRGVPSLLIVPNFFIFTKVNEFIFVILKRQYLEVTMNRKKL